MGQGTGGGGGGTRFRAIYIVSDQVTHHTSLQPKHIP